MATFVTLTATTGRRVLVNLDTTLYFGEDPRGTAITHSMHEDTYTLHVQEPLDEIIKRLYQLDVRVWE